MNVNDRRNNANKRPRVLLADDHRLLCEAFTQLLEPACDVVGTVADGRALLEIAPQLRPDVVVLDIAMPLLNGLEAARQLTASMPDVKVLFLTVSEDPDLAAEAFRCGAAGYLLKNSAASELLEAIECVYAGRKYVTPLAARAVAGQLANKDPETKRPCDITPRQREVLQLLAEGHTMKKIARILKISQRTVAFHKYEMMRHLAIKSTAELVQYAVKQQVVSS